MLAPHIGDVVEKMTTLAGSAAKPAEYRKRVLNRLIPTILPYELDTWATMCRSRRGLGSAPSSRTTTSPIRESNQVWRADDVAGGAGPGCRAGRPELVIELMQAVAANDEAAVRRRAHMTRR